MAGFDWTPYLTGGAARPDAISGLNPTFAGNLSSMIAAAPPNVQAQLRLTSAYRSPDRQAQILSDSLAKRVGPQAVAKWQGYLQAAGGDPVAAGEAARPWLHSIGETAWVAPPGSSNHQKGVAADFKYLDPSATQWAHENAPKYGLNFPLSNEDWHVEPAGLRSGQPQLPVHPASDPVGSVLAANAQTAPQPTAGPVPQAPTPTMGQQFRHAIFGSMAPLPTAPAPTADGSIPASVQAAATPTSEAHNVFGALSTMAALQPQQQAPAPQRVQGPTPDQANALLKFVQSLQARQA